MMRPRALATLFGLATFVASSSASPVDSSKAMRIAIESFAFDPGAVSVKVGTRLEFLNLDQAPHSVIGESDAIGEAFHSQEQIGEGETFDVVVSAPGELTVRCGLHAAMKGKITVTQ